MTATTGFRVSLATPVVDRFYLEPPRKLSSKAPWQPLLHSPRDVCFFCRILTRETRARGIPARLSDKYRSGYTTMGDDMVRVRGQASVGRRLRGFFPQARGISKCVTCGAASKHASTNLTVLYSRVSRFSFRPFRASDRRRSCVIITERDESRCAGSRCFVSIVFAQRARSTSRGELIYCHGFVDIGR